MIKFQPDTINWNRVISQDEIFKIILERVIPEHKEVAKTHPKIHEHAWVIAQNLPGMASGHSNGQWYWAYNCSERIRAELPKEYLDQIAAKKAAEDAARQAETRRQQAAAEAARQAETRRQQAAAEAARQAELQRQQAAAAAEAVRLATEQRVAEEALLQIEIETGTEALHQDIFADIDSAASKEHSMNASMMGLFAVKSEAVGVATAVTSRPAL